MFDPGFILDLEQRLGVLDTVKHKLINQPDKAANKLSDVMDELYKMYASLDEAIVSYLSLYFEKTENIVPYRKVLLELEVGKAVIQINESRGHCHKIKNIYETYLDKWFSRVLDMNEADNLRALFDILSQSDYTMLDAMLTVNDWLKQKAEDTLTRIENNDFPGANEIIKDARLEVKQAREDLTRAMNQLRVLHSDFIDITGVV